MGVDSLDVRVFWPSTHASIPSGWSRDTGFDERFLQGDDAGYTAPQDGGGEHSHTPDEHTHIGDPHTHDFSSAHTVPTKVWIKQHDRGFARVPDAGPPTGSHRHLSIASNVATITYQVPDPTVTISSEDAAPPYKKMIVIKPDLATEDVPEHAVCFTDEVVLPTGFIKYAGLSEKFVRGADEEGGDGGLTGGDTEHDHESPEHGHDDNSHRHAATVCGFSDPTFRADAATEDETCLPTKHHNVELDSKAAGGVAGTAITVDAASSEPAYVKLLGIWNTSGAATTPIGIIAAFVGDADDIPSNWRLCDGTGDTIDCTNKQVKSTGTDEDVGDTGGNDSHDHASPEHGHAQSNHNHDTTAGMYQSRGYVAAAPLRATAVFGVHTHVWTVYIVVATMQNAGVGIQSADGRSAYRTMVWIKKLIERPGPKALWGTTF